jgi:hypothetical protein
MTATRRRGPSGHDERNELHELTDAAVDIAVRSAQAQQLPTYVTDATALRAVAVILVFARKSTPP